MNEGEAIEEKAPNVATEPNIILPYLNGEVAFLVATSKGDPKAPIKSDLTFA